MKDATKQVWNQPVNSQLFRQLCIGITEKHVREVYEPFNRFDDTGAAADRNVVFAWQSGHRPLQRGTTYGLDGAFPTKLQPQLLHLYEWASTRWHEFLHLPSKKLPVHNGDGEPQIQQLHEQAAMSQSNRTAVINTSRVSAQELLPRIASHSMEGEDARRPATSSSRQSEFPTADATDGMFRDVAPSDIPLPPRKRRRLRKSGCSSPFMRQDNIPELFVNSVLHTRSPRETESTPAFRLSMFRHPTDNRSQAATKESRGTIEFLQHYIKERSTALAMELRLDRVYKTAEWWKSVGCEFCFLSMGRLETTHEFANCNKHGSDLAKDIFQWLNSLELPRSLRGQGLCSLCTHTWHPCQEICKFYAITIAQSPREKAMLIEEFHSKPSADGHCERKPLVKRVIASLCAYDHRFLGDLLSKMASDEDGVGLHVEQSARGWFERLTPFKDSRIPGLMFVFEIVVLAFYYRQNSLAGLPPFQGFPESPPANMLSHTTDWMDEVIGLEDWEKSDEIARWRACIEWWQVRCSFCIGQGLTGSSVFHRLKECEKGGAEQGHTSLGKFMYQGGSKTTNGCRRYLMPKEFCPRWGKRWSGEWYQHDKGLWECRYDRYLLQDVIIGLLQCGQNSFKEQLACSAEKHYRYVGSRFISEDEMMCQYLSEDIIVAGVRASRLLEQVTVLTRSIWYVE
ncbi:hypothetical protein ACHAO7_011711 [Fusarium culmorum]